MHYVGASCLSIIRWVNPTDAGKSYMSSLGGQQMIKSVKRLTIV
jgi:hypothetical protein